MTTGDDPENDDLKYLGNLKFGGPFGGQITKKPNLEVWLERATNEFHLAQFSIPILNANDTELERLVRESNDLENWVEFLESCQAQAKRYGDGLKCMESVIGRLAVIIERVEKDVTAH